MDEFGKFKDTHLVPAKIKNSDFLPEKRLKIPCAIFYNLLSPKKYSQSTVINKKFRGI
jgi:hypothetical protein